MRWLWFSCLIVVLDQATKWVACHYLGEVPLVLMPVLQLTLAFNSGAAFSFLSHAGGWQNLFFLGVSIVIIVSLMIILYRSSYSRLATASIIGGALGNLVDRLHYGYVVDFIDVHAGIYHWPVFNVADAFISIGAILMMLSCIRGKK